jgi:hypothetical protein
MLLFYTFQKIEFFRNHTRTHGVTESNPGQVKTSSFLSCSRHVILHKNYYTKVLYYSKICYLTSLYSPIASGASVDPTSQVCSPAMLVLPIVGNCVVRFWVVPNGITSIPNFIQTRPAVLEFKHVDRRTDRHGWRYMRSFHAHRAKKAK